MSASGSDGETNQSVESSKVTQIDSEKKRKRTLSSLSAKEKFTTSRVKRPKIDIINNYFYKSFYDTISRNTFYDSLATERVIIDGKQVWNKIKPVKSRFKTQYESIYGYSSTSGQDFADVAKERPSQPKCSMEDLPQEILLKIFSYLPLGMLLHTIPFVCKRWESLAMDWTLWKTVEDLTIKNMVISTSQLRNLLRTIPKLKKLELILRNDTEELLHELFETHQNLEVLKLDRCYRSTLQMNILSQTVTSILEFCPKLKTVMLIDTYFHSKNFYKSLAKKFKNIERINVTCTSKSEMNIFVENLKENVSHVEFQRVPMMGRAEGKQIYWGPILGLVVRPIPTSPFHQHYMNDYYPNYAF